MNSKLLSRIIEYGWYEHMKTTVDIHDELLVRAKRHAKKNGCPLREVIEDGLRLVLSSSLPSSQYTLPDLRAGVRGAADPLERYS